ncbi:MAG: hypothetical protein H8E44_36400 [Planctomycetes bacterium]|nr:hypothetical protein [Planctomycetota bacterium]
MSTNSLSVVNIARAVWVPCLLVAFAALLLADPLPFADPVSVEMPVRASATDTTPVRQPSLEPKYDVAVFTYRCSECHRIIASPEKTYRTLTQHTEINLQHGINTHCFNCHHRTNRDAFVDDLGNEIPWNEPQLVCAKCHGPVYRDWQHGSHGRTNGYWLTTKGPQTRRKCIECHDPHHPPFPSMKPERAPDTLRMGPQGSGRHSEEHDPLRLTGHAEAGAAAPVSDEGH